jgi:hypothetical protein
MIPKDKADDLIKKFMPYQDDYYNDEPRDGAISCALIAVDECIESIKQLIHHYTNGNDERYASIYLSMSLSVEYWQQVRNELDKL